jgi:hypothetical protein
MISPLGPDEFDRDVLAIDAALDALGRRRPVVADPALSGLASFAQVVDARVAALAPAPLLPRLSHLSGKEASPDEVRLRRFVTDEAKTTVTGRHARTRPTARKRLNRALQAVAVAAATAAFVLAGMLPFNNSPGSPLYPLHQLIFHPDDVALENVELYLASASQALDAATSSSGPPRQAALAQAGRDLAEARKQVGQIVDPGTRTELERQLSNLEQRFTDLADDDDQGDRPDEANNGQDHGDGVGDGASPGRADDPQSERDRSEG